MRIFYEDYRKTLKQPDAEEVVDLLFFRPAAYFAVKVICRLPITPNQISMLSMVFGVVASYFFLSGEVESYRAGAIIFVVANLLDCMDGQLARLQGSGTFFGRVIDGVADYVTGFAVFISLGIGLQGSSGYVWLMVVLSGLSTIVHGIAFDYYQGEFIRTQSGRGNLTVNDVNKYMNERTEADVLKPVQEVLKLVYSIYIKAQQKSLFFFPAPDSNTTDDRREKSMIRWWSFLGPSTNRFLLVVFCIIGTPLYYLYLVMIVGNFWFLVCLFRQGKNAAH